MSIGDDVRVLRRISNLSMQQLAVLSGTNRSTISRIESGETSPTTDVLGRIFSSVGFKLAVQPTANMSAIAAARKAFDPDYSGQLDAEAQRLLSCWTQIGFLDESQIVKYAKRPDLLRLASNQARIAHRPKLDFLPLRNWRKAAELVNGSGVDWALTGGAASNQIYSIGGEEWEMFYVSDIDQVVKFAELQPVQSGYWGQRMILMGFDGICEVNRVERSDGLWLADRTQICLDCWGGTPTGQDQAEALLGIYEG